MKTRHVRVRRVFRVPLDDRGQVLIFAAVSLVVILALAGLALDLGRMFALRAEVSKAVDGGALAGARALPRGTEFAETAARNFAEMNFRSPFLGVTDHSFTITFDMNTSEPKIAVSGQAIMPATLLRIVGVDHVNVGARAEATRKPLALVNVHDTSWSMATGDAIGHLRTAATEFVEYFDDTIDEMALVRYGSGRLVPFGLGPNFKTPITNAIASYVAEGGTTAEDALIAGADEFAGTGNPSAFKGIVFFTDGRPTSFRDLFTVNGIDYDAVIGLFPNPEDEAWPPSDGLLDPFQIFEYIGVPNPDWLPNGHRANTVQILNEARIQTLAAGNYARSRGITIFSIGLGDPAQDPWARPDAGLLVELANVPSAPDPFQPGNTIVNGNFDPAQPEGAFYFAPTAAELEEVFDRLARELTIRLTD